MTHYGARTYTPDLRIGADVKMSRGVHIACLESVRIGDGVLFGSGVLVTDHSHGATDGSDQSLRPADRDLDFGGAVEIGAGCWLGDGVVVLPGTRLGDGCIVGAQSVVRGQFAADSLIVGVPGRAVRILDEGS